MHTTAAYQAAVAQLLIGEANFVGKQLELPGWKSIQTTNEVSLESYKPTEGIGGILTTGDYRFWFSDGRLSQVERIKRMEGPAKNWSMNWDQLRLRPVLETNESRTLARNWLQALGVDTNRLETGHTFQLLQPKIPSLPGKSVPRETALSPHQILQWRLPSSDRFGAPEYSVQVRADSRELWGILLPKTNNTMLRKLVLTNRNDLLGPEPPPLKFVMDMFGGPTPHNIITAPTKVEAELVDQKNEGSLRWVSRKGPVRVTGERAERLSRLLTDFKSYQWTTRLKCGPVYGVRLRFHQGRKVVEVLLCFECFDILIDGKPGEPFSFSHAELLKLMREIFPRDAGLEKLKPVHGNWDDFYRMMEQQLRYYEAKERQ